MPARTRDAIIPSVVNDFQPSPCKAVIFPCLPYGLSARVPDVHPGAMPACELRADAEAAGKRGDG
jgi:hypothetical protein